MKVVYAKRVPPGDRWAIGDDLFESLTECLNEIFMREKVTKFEQWADEQGVWSEFATEGLLIDENKPWAIEKVSI